MATVILSAASPLLPSLQALETLLRVELAAAGEAEVRTFELAATKLAYCQGEFDCWIKTPGTCRALDAEQEIVRAIHDADHLVLLDEVTFGGHGFTVKRAQDRLICLLTPFFEKRSALTHHGARYDKTANLFALGWMPAPDVEQAQTWCALAEANAINMLAPRVGAVVVDDTRRGDWPAQIRAMLAAADEPGSGLDARAPLREALLEAARPMANPSAPQPPRTAALLVGSAKVKGTSASEIIARAFQARLERAGMTTDLHFATEFVHEGAATLAATRAIARADLFVLVTPLYVDSLPALVVHALELVAKNRPLGSIGRLAAVVNCGFPEPEQTRIALRITRHFARRAGYHWVGGLPLGGGGAVAPDVPLDDQHGPASHVRTALDAAAPALARGEDVPTEALELMMRAPLPDSVYRVIGDLRWRYQAHKNGLTQRALRSRPLEP